jgi:hypothetical protein
MQCEEDKMEQFLSILGVAALFFIRIGIPVVILITLGILIDRWQASREGPTRHDGSRHA